MTLICAADPEQELAGGMIFAGAAGRAQSDERRRNAFFFITGLQEKSQEVRLFMLGFNKKTQDASPQENTGGENKVLHFIRTHKKRCLSLIHI